MPACVRTAERCRPYESSGRTGAGGRTMNEERGLVRRVSPSMAARERATDPVGPDYFDLVVTPIGPNRNTIVELLAPDNRGADRR